MSKSQSIGVSQSGASPYDDLDGGIAIVSQQARQLLRVVDHTSARAPCDLTERGVVRARVAEFGRVVDDLERRRWILAASWSPSRATTSSVS